MRIVLNEMLFLSSHSCLPKVEAPIVEEIDSISYNLSPKRARKPSLGDGQAHSSI
jgi:hypothetical protein